MTKKMNIWGRPFNLKVIFDVYEGEDVLRIQEEALETFTAVSDDLLSTYEEVERYCLKKDGDKIGNSIDNIFKYVIPEVIYVLRNRKKRSIVLLCNYRYDEEHGIAMFYENERLKHIGTQNDI